MRLAVVATLYRRPLEEVAAAVRAQTRPPDELWLMCEDETAMLEALKHEWAGESVQVRTVPTPRNATGDYAVIPYSLKINTALDLTDADCIAYLDDGSRPLPRKYEAMVEGLEQHPDWGAVYVTQERTGYAPTTHLATDVIADPYCVLNYTQPAHRRTPDRWTLDMQHARPDIADALFFRALSKSLGPFYPVGGLEPLDVHHMDHSGIA